MKYEDLWNMHKGSDELHNGLASLYEMHTGENGGDPEDELTPKDLDAVRTVVKEFEEGFEGFYDGVMEGEVTAEDIAEEEKLAQLLKDTHEQVGDAVQARQDDCVRIAINIPAPHLSAEQRAKLERDVVKEAAIFSKMWMDALAFGGEDIVMSEESDFAENNEVQPEEEEERITSKNMDSLLKNSDFYNSLEPPEEEEEVETIPEEVMIDIAKKWRETYEQMRPDYDENFEELEAAVIELLIEDGFISPGSHYNVENVDVSTYGGDKQSIVTGPKGSKTVKKEKKK